jgi:hypothetical protein
LRRSSERFAGTLIAAQLDAGFTQTLRDKGRNSRAMFLWTSKVSNALHVDGRCTLALSAMSAAISRSADSSTKT